jgi:NADH-quinone oxidoreductase subunit C
MSPEEEKAEEEKAEEEIEKAKELEKKPVEKPAEKEPEAAPEEAKLELKSEVLDSIKDKLSKFILDSKVQRERRLLMSIKGGDLIPVCETLYDMGFDHLSSISGVEYEDRFEVVYHLWSYSNNNLLTLKAELPKDSPRIASLTSIWRSANWHERETYDLMGIVFEGHPDLRRILNVDDFEGHPLRKDFELVESPWYEEEK